MRKREFGFIVPCAFIGVFCMALGRGHFKEVVDIVDTREASKKWNDGLWYAYLSGGCLAIVSRMSQVLSDSSHLHHEVYMSFYACLITCTFVLSPLLPHMQERHENFNAYSSHMMLHFALISF